MNDIKIKIFKWLIIWNFIKILLIFREWSGFGDIKNCILEIYVFIRIFFVLYGLVMKRIIIYNELIRGLYILF